MLPQDIQLSTRLRYSPSGVYIPIKMRAFRVIICKTSNYRMITCGLYSNLIGTNTVSESNLVTVQLCEPIAVGQPKSLSDLMSARNSAEVLEFK